MPTLGRRAHTAGNKIRYSIDFNNFLEGADATLTTGTVVLATATPAITDVTISGVTVLPSGHLVFFLAGGSNSEIFTVNVTGTDSRGEVVNHTIEFYIVAP